MSWPDSFVAELDTGRTHDALMEMVILGLDKDGALGDLFNELSEHVVAAQSQGVLPVDDGADTRGADDFGARYAANVAAGILEP